MNDNPLDFSAEEIPESLSSKTHIGGYVHGPVLSGNFYGTVNVISVQNTGEEINEAAKTLVEEITKKMPADVQHLIGAPSVINALKQCLVNAVFQYATHDNLGLTKAILQYPGLLQNREVMGELALLLKNDQPDIYLISEKWRLLLKNFSGSPNFEQQAMLLVKYFAKELRDHPIFAPVMEKNDIHALNVQPDATIGALKDLEMLLNDLKMLLNSRLAEFSDKLKESPVSLSEHTRDFIPYILEKSQGFVGRGWVFQAIENFTKNNPRGYFFVMGDPGIGKTALAAQFVRQNGYLHHFNISAEGINKAGTFLQNICAQLIIRYGLNYQTIPVHAMDDSGVLVSLLSQVAHKLGPKDNCIIVIDALDEVDTSELRMGANRLYLPLTLPKGIYIAATMRNSAQFKPRIDCEQETLQILHDSSNNIADITDFIRAFSVRANISQYIHTQGIAQDQFVQHLVEKSEGNFMYLHYVLPEIEYGAYTGWDMAALPRGLQDYYEDHWQRMKGQNLELWFSCKLPILTALTQVKEAVSVDLLSNFSGIDNKAQIRAVLGEWRHFLHEERVNIGENIQKRYRLYHASFFDFIERKQEIADEKIDLEETNDRITDFLFNEWQRTANNE